MAPTEYRVIAAREGAGDARARGPGSRGEALNPEVLRAWRAATGLAIRDGYGQTETGQLTGMPAGRGIRPGSMGRRCRGPRLSVCEDGELVADPATVPTFFLGYLRPDGAPDRTLAHGRSGPTGRGRLPLLRGSHRRRDHLGRLPDRAFEVESALVAHPAVAEAAVVAAPDAERGSVVRAVVVLRDGFAGTPALARELQDHVKASTAPYKYPRVVDSSKSCRRRRAGRSGGRCCGKGESASPQRGGVALLQLRVGDHPPLPGRVGLCARCRRARRGPRCRPRLLALDVSRTRPALISSHRSAETFCAASASSAGMKRWASELTAATIVSACLLVRAALGRLRGGRTNAVPVPGERGGPVDVDLLALDGHRPRRSRGQQ